MIKLNYFLLLIIHLQLVVEFVDLLVALAVGQEWRQVQVWFEEVDFRHQSSKH